MGTIKLEEWIDIDAPQEEVFDIVANCGRRLQLSPSFGETEIEEISGDFPQEGSQYQVRFVKGDELGYETLVTSYLPPREFAYQLTDRQQRRVTWTIQNVVDGIRLTYDIEFLVDGADNEAFIEAERREAREWLSNIKRYAELRDSRIKRLVKWMMDRSLLKWTVAQRRVIVALLAFEAAMFLAFLTAAIGLGIVRFLSR